MSKLARVTAPAALAYRGGVPMLAWLLHRISGVGIVLFVSMHVFAGFLLYSVKGTTGDVSDAVTAFYESLPVQVFILFAVLYHATNGLRIVVLDMWPGLWRYNREAMWVQWALFLPMFAVPGALMLLRVKV